MIRSRSNARAAQPPALIVSHSRQEKVCQDVHEYLTRIKIQKLKEAVQQLNHTIKQMLG